MAEDELADCIKLLAEWGWGFTKEEVKDVIQDFVIELEIKTPFVGSRPGRDWLEGFLKRHVDIVPRKSEQLSNARARAEDPDVIAQWFQLLDKVLTDSVVKGLPANFFNVDESWFVTDPKAQIVLARKGTKRVNKNIGGSGREQITVNCGAAVRCCHHVVYQGKNLYLGWTEGGPAGATYTTSVKGWMEAPQFLDWFRKVFLANTASLSSRTRVLIFDGHASHLSCPYRGSQGKQRYFIATSSSSYSPVFQPVKAKWQSLLVNYSRTHAGPVGKQFSRYVE